MGNLNLQNIGKTYINNAGRQLEVLRGINLHVEKGDIIALLGSSGCGKTTLLNIIAGFESCDTGAASISRGSGEAISQKAGVVFQSPALFQWLNVEENIAFGLKRMAMDKHSREKEIQNILRLVELTGFERYFPKELSGGMQQRVALARVLVMKKEILLLDEPFAALDAITRRQMQELLCSLHRAMKMTVILVTHDVDEALSVAHRIVVLGGSPSTVRQEITIPLSHEDRKKDVHLKQMYELRKSLVL